MFKHENARINVLGKAPHIVTDFGEGDVLPGEDERGAPLFEFIAIGALVRLMADAAIQLSPTHRPRSLCTMFGHE